MKKDAKLSMKNNKGFTLVELLVAILLLGIIVGPLLNSFITSARLNKHSREIAYSTDVAQSLMEGFADKTYEEVKSTVGTLGSSSVNGFSTINGNIYNVSTNNVKIYSGTTATAMTRTSTSFVPGSISTNQIKFYDTVALTTLTLSSNELNSASGNGFEVQSSIIKNYAMDMYDQLASIGASNQMVLIWQDDTSLMTIIGYTNIEYNGYTYDAVCTFIPVADNFKDIYYTYLVRVTLFDARNNHADLQSGNALVSITSGIKSK